MKKEVHWFEKYAKIANKYFTWLVRYNDKTKEKIKKYFSNEYIDNLIFSFVYRCFYFFYSAFIF